MTYTIAVIGSGMAGLAAAHGARRSGRKVFFCGSWAHEGVPPLESAVRSANGVVDAINRASYAIT